MIKNKNFRRLLVCFDCCLIFFLLTGLVQKGILREGDEKSISENRLFFPQQKVVKLGIPILKK